ncbi:microcin C transport system ATP-binding protein [Candidatus Electrothrix aarhusensis]|uniref:Microcin C transport system ATP-binding protein n=1 Tax=Candidatus Electrothrix aarhusensis TaxID=1859131 RepID=A0A3S3U4W5_9BACT|nr:microcin C transport system ATP-binding protein [Candidatus Electrothrix aarhusensis]
MDTLLTIDNLSLTFCSDQEIGGDSQILHDINLTLEQGRTHALVGESGSGKSVTAMSILRLLEDVSTVRTEGRILFNGQDLLQLSRKDIRAVRGNDIAMIFQEPMTSLNPVYTIGKQLTEPLIRHRKMAKEKAEQEAITLLERTGIPDPEQRLQSYPHQLSGGQRQRVMIAMALACRPALLIADEPTTALDVTIQAQILELIKDLQKEFNMAVLLITHDLPLVRKVADTVSIMHQGRIVEQNRTEALFKNPQQDYTRKLLNAIPRFHHQPAALGRPLVTLKDIKCEFVTSMSWEGFFKEKKFKRKKTVFRAVDNVDLTVRQGTTLGIIGESGSGKSTLAFCLLKLQAFKGSVKYFTEGGKKEGVLLSELSNRQMRPLRKRMQIVFQDPFSSLSPRMTVEQIIAEGLKVHDSGHSKAERSLLVQQALEEVELDPDMANRFPHEFSGGQRQRIAIARAIILKPELLILDEPTSALDTTIQAQVIDLLKRLQKNYGMTYIFITHDLRVLRSLADELAVMRQGKIVEQGMADRIFNQPEHPYTKELLRAAFYVEQ